MTVPTDPAKVWEPREELGSRIVDLILAFRLEYPALPPRHIQSAVTSVLARLIVHMEPPELQQPILETAAIMLRRYHQQSLDQRLGDAYLPEGQVVGQPIRLEDE